MDGDNIHVGVRVRPLNEREKASGAVWQVNPSLHTIQQMTIDQKPVPGCYYTFDSLFDAETSTEAVHNTIVRDIISSAMQGMNGTIFAYGMTSSGKTHTMQGNLDEPGVIPLSIADIFKAILETPTREFLLRISYLEIYNESIKDLLHPENDNLKIHENPNKEIYVGNLSAKNVSTPMQVEEWLMLGEQNRHKGVTNMNERSSRSHTLFRIMIESREKSKDDDDTSIYTGPVRTSWLNLVDLAGSERVGHTGAEGIRLKEGGHINKSLLALGKVIAKLAEGDKTHIPYRESKLTRILQPSLGGNARTAIICTVTAASNFCEETHSTLKFASRAKHIRNKPEVNELISEETMLRMYREQIAILTQQLEEVKCRDVLKPSNQINSNSVVNTKENDSKVHYEWRLAEQESEKAQLLEKLEKLKKVILNASTPHLGKEPEKILRARRRQTWYPGVSRVKENVGAGGMVSHAEDLEALIKDRKRRISSASDVSDAKRFHPDLEELIENSGGAFEALETLRAQHDHIAASIQALMSDDDQKIELAPQIQPIQTMIETSRQELAGTNFKLQRLMIEHAETLEFLDVEAEALKLTLNATEEKAMVEIVQLRDQLSQLRRDHETQRMDFEESWQQKYTALQSEKQQLKADMEIEILKLKENLSTSLASSNSLEKEQAIFIVNEANLKKEIAELKMQLNDNTKREAEAMNEHQRQRDEMVLMEVQLKNARVKSQEYQSQCEVLTSELAELRRREDEDVWKFQAKALTEDKSRLEEEIIEIQTNNAEALVQTAAVRVDLENQINLLTTAKVECENKIENVEKKFEQERAALNEANNSLKLQLEAGAVIYNQLNEEYQQLSHKLKTTISENESLQAVSIELQDVTNRLTSENKLQEEALSTTRQELDQLKSVADEMRSHVNLIAEDKARSCHDLQAKIDEITELLRKEEQNFAQEKAKYDAELDKRAQEKAKYEAELDKRAQEKSKYDAELDKSAQELAKALNLLSQYTIEIERISRDAQARIDSMLEDLQIAQDALVEEKMKYDRDVVEVGEELKKALCRIDEFQIEKAARSLRACLSN